MIIDIEPVKIIAEGWHKTVMDIRGISEYYVFKVGEEEMSVYWEPDEFELFRPNIKVSDFIQSTEEGYRGDLNKWEAALKNNEHPVWTKKVVDEEASDKIRTVYKVVPENLDTFNSREGVKLVIERARQKILHPVVFYKIVNS